MARKRSTLVDGTKFAWEGRRPTGGPLPPAQAVGEELERIRRKRGRGSIRQLTPADVVEESRDADAVLHDYFGFDDPEAAARQHWLHMAGRLISRLRIVSQVEGEPRVYRPVYVSPQTGTGYLPTTEAMANREVAEMVVQTNLNQLRGWIRRCRTIARLAGLVVDIESLLNEFDKSHDPGEQSPETGT